MGDWIPDTEFDRRFRADGPSSTDHLVDRFSLALKQKLNAAGQKPGRGDAWSEANWRDACQDELLRHIFKGDPLDVAAYAAFCWHHGWPSDSAGGLRAATNLLVQRAHGASARAGWWADPATGQPHPLTPERVAQKLMLIVSEVAEAMEGHRKGLADDKLPHRSMMEVDLADAVIRIADLAGALGFDLGGALAEKMAFNAIRPDHKPAARTAAGGKLY